MAVGERLAGQKRSAATAGRASDSTLLLLSSLQGAAFGILECIYNEVGNEGGYSVRWVSWAALEAALEARLSLPLAGSSRPATRAAPAVLCARLTLLPPDASQGAKLFWLVFHSILKV